jgi:hypothetical protein
MKKLITEHNNTVYEFRLLEAINVIEVFKDEIFMYVIRQRRNKLVCNCPSGTYRNKCWHTAFALGIYKEESILEPWVLWSEEAGILNYGNSNK